MIQIIVIIAMALLVIAIGYNLGVKYTQFKS